MALQEGRPTCLQRSPAGESERLALVLTVGQALESHGRASGRKGCEGGRRDSRRRPL